MGKLIKDKFTHLKVSRQRKWQLRKREIKACIYCGQPEVKRGYCDKCYHSRFDFKTDRGRYKK